MRIRRLETADLPWVEAVVTEHFASPRIVSRGGLHDVRELPGLSAEDGSGRIGLLQWREDGREWEVITLIALPRRQGVGTRLIKSAEGLAAEEGCERLWLVTTDNNEAALTFYRAAGWEQVAVHEGAVAGARRLKPEIPLFDADGVPICDEIEFERKLVDN